ncbi:unnamed protein product, partial [marine sediment metagenome]
GCNWHDQTDYNIASGSGDVNLKPAGLGVNIGDATNNDFTLSFIGDTSTGILNYDEDNADFEFDQDIITTGDLTGSAIINTAIDADNTTVTNIGSSEITDDIISGFAAVGTFESGDTILCLEDGVGLRECDFDDLPAGGGGAHASTHEVAGDDLVDHDNLTNWVAADHYDWTSETHDFRTTGVGQFGDEVSTASNAALIVAEEYTSIKRPTLGMVSLTPEFTNQSGSALGGNSVPKGTGFTSDTVSGLEFSNVILANAGNGSHLDLKGINITGVVAYQAIATLGESYGIDVNTGA